VDLHGLRPSRPPDGRDDLPPLLDLAAALVPRHVPDDEHSVRHICQAARAGAWSSLQDRLAHVQQDPQRADGRKEPAKQLEGEVEIDETSWGGRPRRKHKTRSEAMLFRERKPTILGMVERGGRVRLRVIASRRGEPLSREVRAHLDPAALMLTDDWIAYKPLRREFGHAVINHSAGVYVEGNVHTNTIEGFFGNLKTGMRGTYKQVSRKWLQSYLDEYAWRYNQRFRGHRSMFHLLLDRAAV
jgi:ISXO2 transposase-like protein